jgi:hypothetical protein
MKSLYLPELAELTDIELKMLIETVQCQPKSPVRDRVLLKLKLLQEMKNHDQRSNINRT